MKNRPIILSIAAALLFAGCAGMGEHEKKVDELGRKVTELKASIDERDAKVEDLNNKFNLLHEKLETAKADIEKLSRPLVPEGLKVVPLEEEPSSAAAPMVEAQAPAKAEGPDELYNKGQDLFLNGNFEESRKVFARFLKAYPDHTLSDNALYWVGESYYSEKDFVAALARFREVVDRYPGENKAPDALLKAAYSCLEMEDIEKGREYLEKVVRKYPGTEAAGKARKALDRLARR
ncbi:MAG: tol-pal system protein YbgF [Deltaproteobacteria bacterium GWB2_55_19]|nr:MAG: tol-pal system protein YbgF [Deltaproteobacteria bacterium GWB2_55_19]HAO93962.1 tol-pal system protein YbgF [Deltaproteobacteria bacterium]